jgi:aminomuconate-semialdehyde/2-hydroxymuconate-6-semialdehyde dehydrogenase
VNNDICRRRLRTVQQGEAVQHIKNFINGEFVEGQGGKTFEKRSPVNNQIIAKISEAGQADVDAAVRAAHAARHGVWGGLTTEQRVDLLYGVADEITRRFEDFVAAEMADTGQPDHVMRQVFIPRGAANFKVFADVIKNVPAESFQMSTPDGKGALNYAIRVPKGVVGVISPWNAPFLLMTWKVGPALACGNTVVVKPSEETPMTTTLLGEVMNQSASRRACSTSSMVSARIRQANS